MPLADVLKNIQALKIKNTGLENIILIVGTNRKIYKKNHRYHQKLYFINPESGVNCYLRSIIFYKNAIS